MSRQFQCSVWRYLFAVAVLAGTVGVAPAQSPDTPWKVGVATTVITPDGPIRMAGYAARNKPSEGKLQDLLTRCL